MSGTISATFPSDAELDMEKDNPLLFCGKNACASLKGGYLTPSLYDRVIQPGDKCSGWIAAEYPKGIKYGSSIGEMRISIAASGHWIGTRSFPANPPIIGHYLDGPNIKEFYTTPIDTLITEDR